MIRIHVKIFRGNKPAIGYFSQSPKICTPAAGKDRATSQVHVPCTPLSTVQFSSVAQSCPTLCKAPPRPKPSSSLNKSLRPHPSLCSNTLPCGPSPDTFAKVPPHCPSGLTLNSPPWRDCPPHTFLSSPPMYICYTVLSKNNHCYVLGLCHV